MEIISQLLILFGLIALSGFFSGVETALFSLHSLRVKYLVQKGVRGAKTVDKLKQNPQRLLITILIGNNIVNVGASAYATLFTIALFGNSFVGYATGILTLVLLIFGEITPKTLATRYNKEISLFVAPILLFLEYALFPIIILFEYFSKGLFKLFGAKKEPLITEEELKSYALVAVELGQIDQDEQKMIERVFRLNDVVAKNVMMPFSKVACVKSTDTLNAAAAKSAKNKHSRLLVLNDNKAVLGFVHVFDLITSKDHPHDSVAKHIRPVVFVDENCRLDDTLHALQKKKTRIAVVLSKEKTVCGVLTYRDVLEEIVGCLIDQLD